MSDPLAGITTLVTRPAEQASRLSDALRQQGARVIEVPAIAIEPPPSWDDLDAAIYRGRYDWVVFTSANGVRFFFWRLQALMKDARWFEGAHVAAIGPETARSLTERSVRPELVPDEYVAEALVACMSASVLLQGTRVLLPRADIARDALALGLEREGAIVDRVVAYRTGPAPAPPALVERLRSGEVDLVTFTSSSTVRSLVAMLGGDTSPLGKMVTACIGPVTAATARELGLQPEVVATTYTIPGLVGAICHYYSKAGGSHD